MSGTLKISLKKEKKKKIGDFLLKNDCDGDRQSILISNQNRTATISFIFDLFYIRKSSNKMIFDDLAISLTYFLTSLVKVLTSILFNGNKTHTFIHTMINMKN